MSKQKIEIEIDIPDGYEFVRFGSVGKGDCFINSLGNVDSWTFEGTSPHLMFVVKKVERWRPANLADVVLLMRGETVEARFRDSAKQDWTYARLDGFRRRPAACWYSPCESWIFCEVKE